MIIPCIRYVHLPGYAATAAAVTVILADELAIAWTPPDVLAWRGGGILAVVASEPNIATVRDHRWTTISIG